MLEQLSQLTLKAQQDQEKIQFLETQVKSLQRETPTVQTPEQLAGVVSHMSIYGDEESRIHIAVLNRKTGEMENLKISNREKAEMIEEVKKRETKLQAELSEVKKNNVTNSTL